MRTIVFANFLKSNIIILYSAHTYELFFTNALLQCGEWSDPLEATSGAGSPDMPKDVQAVPRSSHCIYVSWTEPDNNGAAIMEYRLEGKHNDEEFELVGITLLISYMDCVKWVF